MEQFTNRFGLGRTAVTAAALGLVCGAHVIIALLWWDSPFWWSWSTYAIALCVFHFLEFLWAARCVAWRSLWRREAVTAGLHDA